MQPDVAKFNEEMERFEQAMLGYGAQAGFSLKEAVRNGAKMFARSAARHSPPDAGKAISAKRFKRPIFARAYQISGTQRINLSAEKYLNAQGQPKKEFPNVKSEIFVIRKTVPGTKRFAPVLVQSMVDAKRQEKIGMRGLLRAGWWGALLKLGGEVSEKYGDKVRSMVSQVSSVNESGNQEETSIDLTNRVFGAESISRSAVVFGLGKAANSMNAMTRKLIHEWEKK